MSAICYGPGQCLNEIVVLPLFWFLKSCLGYMVLVFYAEDSMIHTLRGGLAYLLASSDSVWLWNKEENELLGLLDLSSSFNTPFSVSTPLTAFPILSRTQQSTQSSAEHSIVQHEQYSTSQYSTTQRRITIMVGTSQFPKY